MSDEIYFLSRILLGDGIGKNGCTVFDRSGSWYAGDQHVDTVRLEDFADTAPVGNLEAGNVSP